MKIIDNIVPETYQETLHLLMEDGLSIPWYYHVATADPYGEYSFTDDKTKDVPQFVHSFYKDGTIISPYYHLVTPIIMMMEKEFGRNFFDRIIRIKANLITKHENFPHECYNVPHIDIKVDAESAIYYVNHTDGETIMFARNEDSSLKIKDRIPPVRGRLVLFDSHTIHTSTPPTTNNTRIVINFVFRK
jgi:hypothetical protein